MTEQHQQSSSSVDTTSADAALRWGEKVHTTLFAWAVLLASAMLTLLAWTIANDYVEKRAQDRFLFEVNEAEKSIHKRMLEYEQVLRGGVALFAAEQHVVSRQEWHAYVATLQIDKYFPGIQGIGFSYWIPTDGLDKLVDSIRAEGFEDFAVKPAGPRDQYTSIIYLEPMNERNKRAFGFDMYSEPTRHAAMERAIVTGLPSVSGRVTLKQETTKDVQAGFLMYLPVYASGAPVDTEADRRAALLGFVYSPFRIKDLMNGILGAGSDALQFELFDDNVLDDNHHLYDSNDHLVGVRNDSAATRRFYTERVIELPGRAWTAVFVAQPQFEQDMSSQQPTWVAVGGLVVDVLLFSIIMSLSQQRKHIERRAEQMTSELRASERRFRQVVDNAPIAMVLIDDKGRIRMSNRVMEELFGYSGPTLLNMSVDELVPKQFRGGHANNRATYAENPIVRAMGGGRELFGLHKDGHDVPIEIGLTPFPTTDGMYVLATVVDISKRREVDRLKSEFVATVSHELRTPLTSIRGSLGLVAGGAFGALPEQVTHMTDVAVQNADRLIRLINDILDIEKIESGKMRYEIHPQDIAYLCSRSLEETAGYAKQFGVETHLEYDSAAALIANVDADRFNQVLCNLISNAIKFSPKGERVTLSIARNENQVRIGVRDRGNGIPEEFNDRIFQKFAQADGSATRKHSGTGLGLSISKAIVEHFGGRIWFESTTGQGTTFLVELPLVDATPAQ